ncbi:hypothetical protein OG497_04025 [Streptomyces sp. NBC_01242]|uniref:hypothetical protein n=1 Tax=Streptomyces sp. NBC_01242 TaxID=2903795 RepID=UPI002252B18E|nr:hypothetical protein [Streptomyces sp. NBC_01242]MCX4793342.1 hypothetical protein [Streptomyces sp. NBC_01242]
MSTSDQDQAVDTPIAAPEAASEAASAMVPKAASEAEGGTDAVAETTSEAASGATPETAPAAVPETAHEADSQTAPTAGPQADSEADERRLTPRQARQLRIVLSSVGMAAMAVVLALRIASRSSVLVVGVYGLALILCGIVIELSRNGRTRLGSWLLGIGLLAAIGSDWLLIP